MIVEMKKVYVAVRWSDRERLLNTLGQLELVHIYPVDAERAQPDEQTVTTIDRIGRALQILGQVSAAGAKPATTVTEAVDEVLRLQREAAELSSRLNSLHQQVQRQEMWGQMCLADVEQLKQRGVHVSFASMRRDEVASIEADCVEVLADQGGGRVLVALAHGDDELTLPEGAQALELPNRDRPSLLAEAGEVDEKLQGHQQRLAALAHLVEPMEQEKAHLEERAEYTKALRSAVDTADVFAMQGWAPAEDTDRLTAALAEQGVESAVEVGEAAPEEEPPTMVRYPKWAMPIKGLFNILGTVAGYREYDVSAAFMIALPLFAAMLVGDGGYGAVLLFGPLLMWRKVGPALGEEFTKLLMIVGAVAIVWGVLTANFFGVVLYEPWIPVNMSDASRNLVMGITFYIAAIHLSLAQLWRAVTVWPSLRALSGVGWGVFIWGMLGVVNYFVLNHPLDMSTPWPYLLLVGAVLAIVFEQPSKNPLKMLAMGLANFPLSMLSAFSDVISYVRLMAVGLASGVLAASFNELALSTGSWLLAAPILVAGHGLNIGLALIALFAHGVRLNMLEFSNNLGMQWSGYAYAPFAASHIEESKS